jgi:hypothetical protein
VRTGKRCFPGIRQRAAERFPFNNTRTTIILCNPGDEEGPFDIAIFTINQIIW